jgi:nicotinate-nucleotide adenylyltransferase
VTRHGILGGTFDPIHLGHLRAAETAREALGLDGVTFVPSGVPPHGKVPRAAAGDRLAMTLLATAGCRRFLVSDMEVRRQGPSYTVDTLARWREERPADEAFLIVGPDAFRDMATWKDRSRLLGLCTVAVVGRPGEPDPVPGWTDAALRVRVAPGPLLSISSTEVRERLAAGGSVRYLVPLAVAEYIEKRGLYA